MTSAITILAELRKRLLCVLAFFISLFVICFLCSDFIFHWYMLPLQHLLHEPQHLVATKITSPIVTPLTLASHLAILGTSPVALWQIWAIISPALYRSERRTWGWVLASSVLLFSLGCVLCYLFILPCMFQCMLQALPAEVRFLPDIHSVSHFITHMLILFGFSFQIPLICFLLLRLQIIKIEQCRLLRPYVIVAAFTVGMFLTPPDVVAQVLVAVPLWGLYELGMLCARVLNNTVR